MSNGCQWRKKFNYFAVINNDDDYAQRFKNVVPDGVTIYTYGIKNDADKDQKIKQKREELYNQYGYLLDKLQHYADILKEKE